MIPPQRERRRYLLGEAGDPHRSAVEEQYFADEHALAAIEAEEDTLIEEYLANQLGPQEREQFERAYLSAPQRRQRVEIVRRLIRAAPTARADAPGDAVAPFERSIEARWRRATPLAAAAAVVLAVAAWWMFVTPHEPRIGNPSVTQTSPPKVPQSPAQRTPEPAQPGARDATVIAFVLSPLNVRSGDQSPTLTVLPGTTVVSLRLQAPERTNAFPGRVIVRSVSGKEVWRGEATRARDEIAGAMAQVDVPADRLGHDDYLVELHPVDARGVEGEVSRYFLRVRER